MSRQMYSLLTIEPKPLIIYLLCQGYPQRQNFSMVASLYLKMVPNESNIINNLNYDEGFVVGNI
jgi:hypothetical protein